MPSLDPREIVFTALTGPPFVVIILNWGLFGVLSIQVYLYSQAFPKDRPVLKALVYIVYLLETAQTMLLTGSMWNMLARGFGDLLGIDEIGTNWLSVCLIGGLVGLLVQLFYAYRISVISQSRIAPGLIILLSLVSFAGAIATTVFAIRAKRFTVLFTLSLGFNVQPLGFWSGTGSACDVVIAICMCYYLRRRNPYGTFSHTQALISKLVRMTVETGVLTGTSSHLPLSDNPKRCAHPTSPHQQPPSRSSPSRCTTRRAPRPSTTSSSRSPRRRSSTPPRCSRC
ncbi:hypothetical protein BJ912DRAFT_706099 [Pholiota molesta]|nr:hypothetical protein BJ912DRAFT_706099 [Pholiota molesta]